MFTWNCDKHLHVALQSQWIDFNFVTPVVDVPASELPLGLSMWDMTEIDDLACIKQGHHESGMFCAMVLQGFAEKLQCDFNLRISSRQVSPWVVTVVDVQIQCP